MSGQLLNILGSFAVRLKYSNLTFLLIVFIWNNDDSEWNLKLIIALFLC